MKYINANSALRFLHRPRTILRVPVPYSTFSDTTCLASPDKFIGNAAHTDDREHATSRGVVSSSADEPMGPHSFLVPRRARCRRGRTYEACVPHTRLPTGATKKRRADCGDALSREADVPTDHCIDDFTRVGGAIVSATDDSMDVSPRASAAAARQWLADAGRAAGGTARVRIHGTAGSPCGGGTQVLSSAALRHSRPGRSSASSAQETSDAAMLRTILTLGSARESASDRRPDERRVVGRGRAGTRSSSRGISRAFSGSSQTAPLPRAEPGEQKPADALDAAEGGWREPSLRWNHQRLGCRNGTWSGPLPAVVGAGVPQELGEKGNALSLAWAHQKVRGGRRFTPASSRPSPTRWSGVSTEVMGYVHAAKLETALHLDTCDAASAAAADGVGAFAAACVYVPRRQARAVPGSSMAAARPRMRTHTAPPDDLYTLDVTRATNLSSGHRLRHRRGLSPDRAPSSTFHDPIDVTVPCISPTNVTTTGVCSGSREETYALEDSDAGDRDLWAPEVGCPASRRKFWPRLRGRRPHCLSSTNHVGHTQPIVLPSIFPDPAL
eukprot:TRINITY_DN55635_c0_g1_i1.p1 TRINITY_DN55635_c0_g1~~TRINITY_DN55635_c0_g1_i1.p1  ORF type:complete len:556 (+),score=21.50 TRINITY_DN55635_c0_g1_i1:121-1788(+)